MLAPELLSSEDGSADSQKSPMNLEGETVVHSESNKNPDTGETVSINSDQKKTIPSTPGLPLDYWTFDKCLEEARKYTSKVDFSDHNVLAYFSALKNGWLERICEHMYHGNNYENLHKRKLNHSDSYFIEMRPPRAHGRNEGKMFWTFENCQREALKYESRSAFQKGTSSAYHAARRYNWLDEVCKHMPTVTYQGEHWTFEKCKQEALKYTSRSELQKHSSGAYNSARRHGWLDTICGHMTRSLWTLDSCRREALKYRSRSEFHKHSGSAYNAALRNYWLDEICTHMGHGYQQYSVRTPASSQRSSYSKFENLLDVASASAANFEKEIAKDHSEHSDANSSYASLLADTATEKSQKDPESIVAADSTEWTLERCIEEAKRFKTRFEFCKSSGAAYDTAKRNGWISEVCSHMTSIQMPTGHWTRENCHEEALCYTSRVEFRKRSGGAYYAAWRKGFLDAICSHMKSPPPPETSFLKENDMATPPPI